MTFDEFEKLMKLEKRELVIKIWELQNRVAELEKQNSDMGWQLNPDRMGGQFTEEEKNRSGWL
jgi:hypothetical protein